MSYDVIAWAGARPSGREADRLFEINADRYDELYDKGVPPTPGVLAFLADVVALWPDDDFEAPELFWSVAPVSPGSGAGDVAYLTMAFHDRLDDMVPDIARLAPEHSMVAYDPQLETVIS